MKESVESLVERLLQARDVYYNQGESSLSDAEFDSLEDELRERDPHNPYFSSVGIGGEESGGGKITHPVPMLSMGKAKTPAEVVKWMKRLALDGQRDFCVQPKIDGLGASCRYRHGSLLYVATRGDGLQGQDITHVSSYMEDIPRRISFSEDDIEIRGELYLPKDTPYDTKGKPLRNNCVGLINRKEDRDDLHHVRFVCYQIMTSQGEDVSPRESQKIALLEQEGFHTVDYHIINGEEQVESVYRNYLEKDRDRWQYETDGLIIAVDETGLHDEIDSRWVVDHHHHYAIALKPPAQGKQTRLVDVEWQISRQGHLIPVACFEPIELGGATLERATLHNAQFVRDLLLMRGDRLTIERANDVIPYVRTNHSSQGRNSEQYIHPLIPRQCPVCASPLEDRGVHIRCTNRQCPERQIQSILYWVKQSEMEQIAEGTIRQLYREGKVRSIKDLYTLTESDFEGLEGFGEKKITNFVNQTREKRHMTAVEFIGKLGIPLVQKKALRKLGISSMEEFFAFHDETYITGQNIITWRDENAELLDELVHTVEIVEETPSAQALEICMTGKGPMGRKELAALAEKRGFLPSSSVTKKTALLVCDNPEGNSSKLQKARSLGIEVLTYEDFLAQNDRQD